MSNRIDLVLSACRREGRAALVGYLTAGDPNPVDSERLLLALASQVDLLEIGMPFSDPMADGAVIQAASERALAAGTESRDLFHLLTKVRSSYPQLAIVLMGYGNSALAIGMESFAEQAAAGGADGVLLVDIPPEEGAICDDILRQQGLQRILLLTPTSPAERMRRVADCASGFIYYVSLTGTTGASMGSVESIKRRVADIGRVSSLPVCVGFGVKTVEQAAQIAAVADGVVVGSRFVTLIAEHLDDLEEAEQRLLAEAMSMRKAMVKEGV
ncbi:MAG: tryptophan synthase subunit alpha [Mariprofundales bacterium]|nr:tryptophan synthase subunit alpha [Mariprofundales bacterium]